MEAPMKRLPYVLARASYGGSEAPAPDAPRGFSTEAPLVEAPAPPTQRLPYGGFFVEALPTEAPA